MTYTNDRVLKLESQLRKLMMAAKNIGFNTQDANDIEYLFAELRVYSSFVHTEHHHAAHERLSAIFEGG